jgi:hypothetical protein
MKIVGAKERDEWSDEPEPATAKLVFRAWT